MEGGGSLTLRKFPIVRLSVIFFLLLKVVTVVNYEAGRATHALTHTHAVRAKSGVFFWRPPAEFPIQVNCILLRVYTPRVE